MAMPDTEKLSALQPAGGHRTLPERAFATVHEAIVTGVLAPGERLPIEELAAVPQTTGASGPESLYAPSCFAHGSRRSCS